MTAPAAVPILTYHSISDAPGPTSIPRSQFEAQLDAIVEAGVDVISLDRHLKWRDGEELERRSLVITFDDAFKDFADVAHPALAVRGMAATVFVPAARVGGAEHWYGADAAPRPLMHWSDIAHLAAAGVEFGSHSMTHPDLTALDDATLAQELDASRTELEDRLGRSIRHFAPPYGRTDPRVRDAIAKHYDVSVGVRFDEATRASPLFDLPRIEMHYYRDIGRWRAFLAGKGGAYFQARRAARGLREAVEGAARRFTRASAR